MPEDINLPNSEVPPTETEEIINQPTSEEGTQEQTTEEETQEETVEIDPQDPYAPYQTLRAEMIAKGVDFTEMDALVASNQSLTDEHINTIAEHSGRKVEDVKAYMNLAQRLTTVSEKAVAHDESVQNAYLTEINEISGGDYQELIDFVAKEAPPEKIKSWNILLNTKDDKGNIDTDLQKVTLKEMAAYRQSKAPAPSPVPAKQADLGLLTKANNSASKVPVTAGKEENTDPLAGNPLANASLQALCQIKIDPKHPQRENALAVMRVRHPDLL